MSDRFAGMSRADLAAYLRERGHEFRASSTRAELQTLCRAAATRATLRRTSEEHRRALEVLRGRSFAYGAPTAVQILEELIADAAQLAAALGEARQQLHAKATTGGAA